MAVEGADPDQLRAAATQFNKGASALETSAKALHSLIGTTTQWTGPDADRFRSQWSSMSARTITAAVNALRQAADALRRNANEQETASKVNPGDQVAVKVYGSAAAPVGTAGLYRAIHSTDNSHDGIRIQEVVGSDGESRFIVYLNGTAASDDMTVATNVPAAAGRIDQDPDIVKRIDEALAAAGYKPGPDGPEMMLVGYSQGGMDAQNLAAMHKYNVTNLVTYGSPLTQADQPGITTVHLRAVGDNVPNLPAEVGALAEGPAGILSEIALRAGVDGVIGNDLPLDAPLSGPSDAIFLRDPHVAQTDWLVGNHSVEDTYLRIGADFDSAKDTALVAKQEDIARFQGDVVRDWQPVPEKQISN